MKNYKIGKKMYFFVAATVLIVAIGVCVLNYEINASQIDDYFKRLTLNTAQYYATQVDVEFLKELREVVESDEYQELRALAEEAKDDFTIIDYLTEKGLWDKYEEERNKMIEFLNSMTDIKYLYIIVWGEADSDRDMYLLDADLVPYYETGYYELREPEFAGVNPTDVIQPVINNGDWGWLCSGYAPVFDDEGNIVCHVGCDIGMEEIVNERRLSFSYMVLGAVICAALVLVGAVLFVNRTVVNPIKTLTREMKNFAPGEKRDYQEAGVIDLDIKSNDEIKDLYNEIRSMQIRISDHINSITAIQHEKEMTENVLKYKEKEIGEISEEAYTDPLTGAGNKNAYNKRIERIEQALKKGPEEFAIVMVDVNGLKYINDNFGHAAGDIYLKGSCNIITEVYNTTTVYRIGGDEFVVVLQGDDYKRRQESLNKVRAAFEKSYNGNKDGDPWFRYSASAGMAEYGEGDTIEEVFKRADELMYIEKTEFKKRK